MQTNKQKRYPSNNTLELSFQEALVSFWVFFEEKKLGLKKEKLKRIGRTLHTLFSINCWIGFEVK